MTHPPPGAVVGTTGRTLASPASQALAAATFAVVFAALAIRMGSAMWFAAPTAALLLGIVIGLGADLRRFSAVLPGFVAGLITLVGLTMLWAVVLGSFEVMAPYPAVPLAALVVLGTDWWWVERLRPLAVASGIPMVLLLHGEVGETLPLALAWFGVVAAVLWSMRRDLDRDVPRPAPLGSGAVPAVEAGPARTVAAVGASWLAAAAVIALVSLVPLWFDSPRTAGRLGGDRSGLSGVAAGGGQTGGGPSGIDPGPGTIPGDTGGTIGPGDGRDVDGDGIPDRDIDGDGRPDVDIDGDGIPDVDRDGDGVPDDLSAPGGTDPGGAGSGPGDGTTAGDDDEGGGAADRGDARGVARVLGLAVGVLLVAALVVLTVRAVRRALAQRRALAARPWAVRLAERLEQEGARRGRGRRRDEPVTRYADALAGDVLAHDRLGDVGVALSAALFGAQAPSEATGEWAAGVVDEAVAANPLPTWWEGVRGRVRRSPA